ncbi:MAG: hypothetical protein O2904_02250 [bacterium]|nr:hypothetical protein [bacterium]
MEITAVQALIQESHILTDAERVYWTKSLVKMTPDQMQKLVDILTKAQDIPWTKQVSNYFNLIAKSAKSAVARS